MSCFCSLEQLAEGSSPLHRLHPGVKLAITLAFVLCVISFPVGALSALTPFAAYPIVAMALSGTPWKPLLQRMAIAAPFVGFAALCNLFLDQTPLWTWGPIPVTGGMLSCLSVVLRAFLCVSAVLILIATTSMTALTGQLLRLHVPPILCLQLTLTYRYVSVLIRQAQQMYNAYQLRSCARHGIHMRDMGCFLGQLLLRSYDQSQRIYCAMKCRGYDGVYREGPRTSASPAELFLLGGVVAGFLFLRFLNLSLLLGGLF